MTQGETKGSELMSNQAEVERAIGKAQRKFEFEVASATHRLFRLLTGVDLLRSAIGWPQTQGANFGHAVISPSYLDVFVSMDVAPGDEDPLAQCGSVEQSAYLSWVAEVVSANERSRSALQAAFKQLAPDAIQPETSVLGDLNKIRNDLLHNDRVASPARTGKCEVLQWFDIGDRILLQPKHVFDFLNQLGMYGGRLFARDEGVVPFVSVSWMLPEGLARQPVPRVVSVRPVVAAHRETGQDHRGLSLVYENGVHVACDLGEGGPVANVEIRADGAVICVPDLDEIDALSLYQESIVWHLTHPSEQSHLHAPWGPRSRFRRDPA